MRHAILLILIMSNLLGSRSYAALSLDIINHIDIKAIKSINLQKVNNEFKAEVVVQFSTSAEAAVKFKQADFVITFTNGKDQKIHLGTTQPAEILFPASDSGHEELTETKLEVLVGEDNLETINRLVKLFNLIGNPNSEFAMILTGSTEVGVKAKRGWIYQGRVQLEDFTFHPTIQREVLFK
ncbi:MAG: hypothetical protein HC877_13010 [Thioploca sp.]|nr:hypothetical protein [Thioploca sp.]